MLISVCIPQYNRSRYLLAVLDSIRIQDHPEVEVIISDDCSTDDSLEVIPNYIAAVEGSTRVRFSYIRQPKNLGYDGNLRASLAAASGDYLFILGNDDALAEKDTLSKLAEILAQLDHPDVCFTNFHLYGKPNEIVRRARVTAVLGSGPEVAVRTFRSFSFVGGVVFKRTAFHEHDTSVHDGSIYVQIFLAARIIASGGTLASIAESTVAKDVSFPGEQVNTYLDTLARDNRKIHPETGGLDQVVTVASAAIMSSIEPRFRARYCLLILAQIILFTYPFWLFTYRQHRVYRAAVNLALGCFPFYLGRKTNMPTFVKLLIIPFYLLITLAGLTLPLVIYGSFKERASKLSRTLMRPAEATSI